MGSFLSRTLLMASGYAFPAYECFKAVEKSEPEAEQLRFWSQYWILVAILTVCERIGDPFLSWLPLYNEAKLAFVVYLWYPKWKGTTYVYNSFVRPVVVKHETEIDQSLSELKVKAGEIGGLYWQRAMSYGQTLLLEILQYFSSQQQQRQQSLRKTESLDSCQASVTKSEQLEQPPPDSSSLSEEHSEAKNEPGFLQSNKRMISVQSCVKTTSQSSIETGAIQPTASLGNGDSNSSQEQTSDKEAVAKRRGIWRIFKTAAH